MPKEKKEGKQQKISSVVSEARSNLLKHQIQNLHSNIGKMHSEILVFP